MMSLSLCSTSSHISKDWTKYLNTLACASNKHSFGVDKQTGKLKLVPRESRKTSPVSAGEAAQFLRTEKIKAVLINMLDETMRISSASSISEQTKLHEAVNALQKRLKVFESDSFADIQRKFIEVLQLSDPITHELIVAGNSLSTTCCLQVFDDQSLAGWLAASPENTCPCCRDPGIRDQLFEHIKSKPIQTWPLFALSTNRLGDTLLHEAVRRRNAGISAELLKAGCPVNSKGQKGNTALHVLFQTLQQESIGAWYSDYEAWFPLFEVLCRSGAWQNAQNDANHVPLHGCEPKTIVCFIEQGASLQGFDDALLQKLLEFSVMYQKFNALDRLLVETPARLLAERWPMASNIITRCLAVGDGGRPINFKEGHYARSLPGDLVNNCVRGGMLTVVQEFINHGFPVQEYRSSRSESLADIALMKREDDIALLLLQHNVPITIPYRDLYLKDCPKAKAFLERGV